MLVVIEPGLASSVQDRGRVGQGHAGVARAGAADQLAYTVANVLVGNLAGVAVLEMTLSGGVFDVVCDGVIGIAGADMDARVMDTGRSLSRGNAYDVRAGQRLAFAGARDGARTYLALRGGIRVDAVLGSRSTDPVAEFGGLHGRGLRSGDRLEAGTDVDGEAWTVPWPAGVPDSGISLLPGPRELAVVAGPHRDLVATAFSTTTWTVSAHHDRVGLRLDGPPVAVSERLDLPSFPMLPGAVQLPSDGHPIVLLPDAPTVGGYPVPGVVAEVDQPALGQLRAGDEVRFVWTETEVARSWQRDQVIALAAVRPMQ